MATKPQDVTQVKFYDVNDIMKITGFKESKCYAIMRDVNKRQKELGKLVLKGRVNAAAFNAIW